MARVFLPVDYSGLTEYAWLHGLILPFTNERKTQDSLDVQQYQVIMRPLYMGPLQQCLLENQTQRCDVLKVFHVA